MSELKTIIDANIKENGNQEITGKTLNYVLNKIAEGTEKDWNESDATKGGYIKGRTHGVTYELVSVEGTLKELGYVPGEYVSVLHYARVNGVLEGKGLYLGGLLYNPIVGEEYEVKYAGPSVYAKVVEVEDGYDVQIKGASDTGNILKVAIVGYKTIDDAYISTDIARKSQVDALEQKLNNLPQGEEFDKQGNYPLLHVGTADDLAGRGESVPAEFGFRASGGKSIKDGRAYIKRIKGNSVVWNQLWDINGDNRTDNVANMTINEGEVVLTIQGIGTNIRIRTPYTIGVVGHKYYVTYQAKYNSKSDDSSLIAFVGMSNSYANQLPLTNSYQTYSGIWVGDYAGPMNVGIIGTRNDGDIVSFKDIKVIDLTQMFQAGNEPSTIEEFYQRIPSGIDLNAYNEGEVIHCNTESIKSVGDNAWDEEWELGKLNSRGEPNADNTLIRSKNFTRVIPNETYYFHGVYGYGIYFYDADKNYVTTLYVNNNKLQIPSNAIYLKFNFPTDYGTTYKGDYMITLVHSGWKQDTDAGYQPYWQDILRLPIISKYFPDGMKSTGSAHDEIRYNKASGKWEAAQRIGSVDMGDLDWEYISNDDPFFRVEIPLKRADVIQGQRSQLICVIYSIGETTYYSSHKQDKTIYESFTNGNENWIYVKDSAYTDAATFKAAMAGVILYYEAADWEWEELDAEDQNFRDYYQVADFGTEQAISTTPSAAFSADIIYQFNAVDMIREHELEITELQDAIKAMQAQLASLTNS